MFKSPQDGALLGACLMIPVGGFSKFDKVLETNRKLLSLISVIAATNMINEAVKHIPKDGSNLEKSI